MSFYRRKTKWHDPSEKVAVTFHWDNLSNAVYVVKFDKIGAHWDKVQSTINFIKATIPSSQREYDPDTKTWYIGESAYKNLLDVLNAIPQFEVSFLEKPAQVTAQRFHSKEDDFTRWKQILSMSHIQVPMDKVPSFQEAVKLYRRAAMYLHPDRNPSMASEMSELNEVWNRLKPDSEGKGGYFQNGSSN
jgi:hypothetical protein